jgi:large subunit ribosomal protein L6
MRLEKRRILKVTPEVTVTFKQPERLLEVGGKLGTTSLVLPVGVTFKTLSKNEFSVVPASETKFARSLAGTIFALFKNMTLGVQQPFMVKTKVFGVGCQVDVKQQGEQTFLVIDLKLSKLISVLIPSGIKITIQERKTLVQLTGIENQKLGEVASLVLAKTRKFTTLPFRGKGVYLFTGQELKFKLSKSKVK